MTNLDGCGYDNNTSLGDGRRYFTYLAICVWAVVQTRHVELMDSVCLGSGFRIILPNDNFMLESYDHDQIMVSGSFGVLPGFWSKIPPESPWKWFVSKMQRELCDAAGLKVSCQIIEIYCLWTGFSINLSKVIVDTRSMCHTYLELTATKQAEGNDTTTTVRDVMDTK